MMKHLKKVSFLILALSFFSSSINVTSFAATSTQLSTVKGSLVIEAEDLDYNKSNFGLVSGTNMSGEKGLAVLNQDKTIPASTANPDIDLSFTADKTGTYFIWLRNTATQQNNAGNSIFLNLGNTGYKYTALMAGTPTEFGWSKLGSIAVNAGQTGSVKIIRRQNYQIVFDKFIITSNKTFTPKDMGGDPNVYQYSPLTDNVYPKPGITPPLTHPRLMFTANDIPTIKANFMAEQNKTAYTAWQKSLNATINSRLPSVNPGGTNYNPAVLATIEALAFDYAINGNTENGKKAVEHIKNVMDTVVFDNSALVDRVKSPVMFTICEVYDWCYPLMTDQDRIDSTAYIENLAATVEGGYPLNKMGSVTGHGGEQFLLNDMLSFGIATYNERPDIYNFFAGRILSEFVPARDYMYTSDGHNQGNAYGDGRGFNEIGSAWLLKRMSGQDVFSANQQYFPYTWLYSRRPDGQVLRMGDDYYEAGKSNYWSGWAGTLFRVANYYNDPFLKREYAREAPLMETSTPVQFLAYNNPNLTGKPATELPLSKYFAYPKGMMIARTGWNDGMNAPDAVAMMNIGEHWGANHNHVDSGSFQLYYKGILASDSGQYSDGYGSEHDFNYNKRGIANNILTIYDPNEKMVYYQPVANDGGQRTPANGVEPSTLEQWKDPTYDTGKVLDHEFGPDPVKPEYTYIKGDITKAYSDKVSEVLRSMAFLPLEDADHPAAMIVMDKVVAKDPSFKKSWLLHTQEEPTVEGNKTTVTRTQRGNNGKMVVETLLPENPKIEKIGGDGKQFWIDGKNYAPKVQDPPLSDSEADAWGRVEVSPSTPAATDFFLNVMTVSDADTKAADLKSTLIEGDKLVGAVLSDRVAIFGKDADRMDTELRFTIPGEGSFKVFVFGIKEGTWTTADGQEVVVTQEGGAACFQANAGEVVLTYKNDNAIRSQIPPVVDNTDPIGIRIGKAFLYSDVKPLKIQDTVLMPYQQIFGQLGATASYDNATKTVTGTKDGVDIQFTAGSNTAYVGGEAKEMDAPATIVNDNFYIPVKFTAEVMGARVTWDPFANLMDIVPSKMPHTGVETAEIVNCTWSDFFTESSGIQSTGEKSYDGNPDTMWAVEGDSQWVAYEFKEPSRISSVYVLLNKATERQAYFDFQVSDDGVNYRTIQSCTSDGKSEGEIFQLQQPVTTKYFRYFAKGNSVSKWNGLREIEFITGWPATVTKAILSPAEPNGANGWYTQPVTVSLTATATMFGVAKTEYSLDGGSTWQDYSAPITLNQNNRYIVGYRSWDTAGKVEKTKTIAVNLDESSPEIVISSPIEGNYSDAEDLSPQFTVMDTVSGVDPLKTSIMLDDQKLVQDTTIELYTLPLGSHILTVTSGDLAGNVQNRTINFWTVASLDSLKALVKRFADKNWIDNEGIANSLQQKLEQGNLKAFQQEVQAQDGKHITSETAKVLLRDVQALMEH